MPLRTQPGMRPRVRAGLTTGLVQVIDLLSLSAQGLTARLALAAAENPSLRLVPPDSLHWARPLADAERFVAPDGSLIAHVLARIDAMRLAPRDRIIAIALAEQLEPTGWLGASAKSVARDCGLDEAEVEKVLHRLQQIEPAGLFARNLRECLALQAAASGLLDEPLQAVLDHLQLLADGDRDEIARISGLDRQALDRAAGVLRGLNPKPGLIFAGPSLPLPPPDLVLRPDGEGWHLSHHPAAPRAAAGEGGGDLRSARMLVAAVERRRDNLLHVARLLVDRQEAYLRGTGTLAAMTSSELVGPTGLSRSSVNRILSSATMETPRGTLALRGLIARPLGANGPSVPAIKARLAELLAGAAGERRSDAWLSGRLAAEGMPLARRTVAKYRRELRH